MRPFLLSGPGPEKGHEMVYIFKHAQDHILKGWDLGPLHVTKFGVMVVFTATLLTLIAARMDRKSLVPRGFFRNAFEGLVYFIRDGLVRPSFGGAHHGDAFVPFFCTVFLFIFSMNLMGLVPWSPTINGSATASPFVTGTMALIVLLSGFIIALIKNGPVKLLGAFVPAGVPLALVPLLFILELLGHLVKHAVLMIRLSANMLAGHLVLGAFIGMIFTLDAPKAVVIPGAILLSLFVSTLEILVSFLQAYIFTLLSVFLMGAVVHPEH